MKKQRYDQSSYQSTAVSKSNLLQKYLAQRDQTQDLMQSIKSQQQTSLKRMNLYSSQSANRTISKNGGKEASPGNPSQSYTNVSLSGILHAQASKVSKRLARGQTPNQGPTRANRIDVETQAGPTQRQVSADQNRHNQRIKYDYLANGTDLAALQQASNWAYNNTQDLLESNPKYSIKNGPQYPDSSCLNSQVSAEIH